MRIVTSDVQAHAPLSTTLAVYFSFLAHRLNKPCEREAAQRMRALDQGELTMARLRTTGGTYGCCVQSTRSLTI